MGGLISSIIVGMEDTNEEMMKKVIDYNKLGYEFIRLSSRECWNKIIFWFIMGINNKIWSM